jgi:hypothetical protein
MTMFKQPPVRTSNLQYDVWSRTYSLKNVPAIPVAPLSQAMLERLRGV